MVPKLTLPEVVGAIVGRVRSADASTPDGNDVCLDPAVDRPVTESPCDCVAAYRFRLSQARAGAGSILFRKGVNGRTQACVDEALARLRADVPAAAVDGIAADLAVADGCRALLAELPSVDVNNLGIFEPKHFADNIPDEDWLRFVETNVLRGIRLSRHYVAGMQVRNWGRIVFVSSESGREISTEMIHYVVKTV